MDNEDVGKPVSDYFGVTDGPKVSSLIFLSSSSIIFVFNFGK